MPGHIFNKLEMHFSHFIKGTNKHRYVCVNTHGKTTLSLCGEETVNLLHVIKHGKLGGLVMISNKNPFLFCLFLHSHYLMYCFFIQ